LLTGGQNVCTVWLQVASEDTVLFTAQAYADKLGTANHWDREGLALHTLAPLVRCPHLSQFWMSAAVLSDEARKLLLQKLQPQLKRLLFMKMTKTTEVGTSIAEIPDVPASWLLPAHGIQPVSSISLDWRVDVAAIRQTAQISSSQRTTSSMISAASSPLGGIRWCIELCCKWDPSKQGSTIRVSACPKSLPAGSFWRCTFSLECVAAAAVRPRMTETCLDSKRPSCGWGYFFGLGAMPGGFDDAAWAAKGLPTSGSVVLKLTVKDVGI
jgi:hypothetical protein